MNAIRYTVAAAAATAAVVALAPTAHAGQWSYVRFLDDNGVAYADVRGVIDLGKQVCHELRSGTSLWFIAEQLTGPLGYTGPEAGAIVIGAVGEMCPDTAAAVEQELDNTPTSQIA